MIDYCIVGGGVLGCAIGKTILQNEPEASVVILEKFSGVGQGNTIRSNAAYRNIFDTAINIQLSSSSINYYKYMEQQGEDFGRKEIGYLFLLSEQDFNNYQKPKFRYKDKKVNFFDFLTSHEISYEILDKNQLSEKFPELELDPNTKTSDLIGTKSIQYGFLGKQCGHFSPDLVVQHYVNKFKAMGGSVRLNHKVLEIVIGKLSGKFDPDYIPKVWEPSEVKGVKVEDHEGKIKYIQARKIILATGAWINEILDPIGVRSLVKAKKRQLFTIPVVEEFIKNTSFSSEFDVFPFTILPEGGVFLKPLDNANSVVVGTSDVIGRRFEPTYNPVHQRSSRQMDDPQAEEDFYTYNILPVLQSYFPAIFSNTTQVHGTAGNYAYSVDKYPVIAKVDPLPNLYFASGASGSGIMKADSIARICDALVRGHDEAVLFSGDKVKVERFGIKHRELPDETLVL